jgi:hypothetical protein
LQFLKYGQEPRLIFVGGPQPHIHVSLSKTILTAFQSGLVKL